jgi:hypothetical protein
VEREEAKRLREVREVVHHKDTKRNGQIGLLDCWIVGLLLLSKFDFYDFLIVKLQFYNVNLFTGSKDCNRKSADKIIIPGFFADLNEYSGFYGA